MNYNELVFKAGTHNKMQHGLQYLKGLFQGRKRNIERMVERVVDSEYYSIQHFISESPWDARVGFDKVAFDTSKIFESYSEVALQIDESAHRKKGKESVGVSRQYCGTIGKVDNCQVAVYGH
jgi:SRSO17 transposase